MTDTTQMRNARAVVQSWRQEQHIAHWDPPAHSKTPGELFTILSEQWAAISKYIDDTCDGLRAVGFQPSHPEVRELRKVASNAAHRHQRHASWAADLNAAEKEIDHEPYVYE